MDGLVSAVAQHGYSILFGGVFLEVIGFPIPAAPLLIVAGGASAKGPLQPGLALLTAISAMIGGDMLMYVLGRSTGWWLLRLLCRLSISPESCIFRSADAFYKRGRMVLVFSKFIPGINALAAPLAGSMQMRVPLFVGFDLAGATLYASTYGVLGYLLSDVIAQMTRTYTQFEHYAAWAVAMVFAVYVGYRSYQVLKERGGPAVDRVMPQEVAARADPTAVYDVRSHGYYEPSAMRIRGASRLEPNTLQQHMEDLPRDREILLYCTCVGDATSIKVARALKVAGFRVSVIAGGLRAWRKAGLPLERVPAEDIVQLPTFI